MATRLGPTLQITDNPVFDYEVPDDPDNPGKYVYHYTKWDRLLNIMHNGFRLGTLTYMNDPRESKVWALNTVRFNAGSVNRSAFNEAVADYKRRIRIGAFCLDQPSMPDGEQGPRGYARPRMWAQYADNHRGVCIVLNRESLNQAICERYPDHDGSWVQNGKVKYITPRDDPASISMEYREDDIQAGVRKSFDTRRDSIFFVKHLDWRDENEYRWVYFDADGSGTGDDGREGPFVDIKDSVAGLVLGEDYEDPHLPVARMFADHCELNGNVARCRWNRLTLYLDAFTDEDGRLVPLHTQPDTFDFLIDGVRTIVLPRADLQHRPAMTA